MPDGDNFDKESAPHRARAEQVRSLIEEVLRHGGVRVHSVQHRVKSEQSARAKIAAQPDQYGSFRELHDLLGVRVITFLVTDVQNVVSVLRQEFEVDEARTVDKADQLDDGEFGYQSFHLVLTLNETRASLPEWSPFGDIYFEVQVRSILQHAWAEIEHDLGYKSPQGLPRAIRRRFARLAGTLESADEEFVGLTEDVGKHTESTRAAISKGQDVAVNQDAVAALTLREGPVRQADVGIARGVGARLEREPSSVYTDLRASELQQVGLDTVDKVTAAMEADGEAVVRFAVAWLLQGRTIRDSADNEEVAALDDGDVEDLSTLAPGISLFYLYLHRRIEAEGDAFHAVPGAPEDDWEPDGFTYIDRALAFRETHRAAFVGHAPPSDDQ